MQGGIVSVLSHLITLLDKPQESVSIILVRFRNGILFSETPATVQLSGDCHEAQIATLVGLSAHLPTTCRLPFEMLKVSVTLF